MSLEERIYHQFQNIYDELANLDSGDRERFLLKKYSDDPDLVKGLIALFEAVDQDDGDTLNAGRGSFLNARDFFTDNLDEPFYKDDGRVRDRNLIGGGLINSDSDSSEPSMLSDENVHAGSLNHISFDKKYDLGKEIGRGGMGVVLEGQDLDLRRTVAIKFMKDNPELVGDVITIGDWMVSEFQLFDAVFEIYRKWSLEPSLLPLIRENLKRKCASLDHKKQLLKKEKIDLVDVFLGKRPGLPIISTSPELLSKDQSVINVQSQKHTVLVPSSNGLHIFSPFTGVLVQLGNRPVQFEAELEARHMAWWSGLNFGLFSLSALQTNSHTNDAVYSGIGSGGGSYLNEFGLAMNPNPNQGVLPKIDHLIGKKINIRGLLDDDGTFRLTLREKSTGDLIYTHKTSNVNIMPGQIALFGVRSFIYGNNMEGILHHLKLFGGVKVVDKSDPRVTTFFRQFPMIENLSKISVAKTKNFDVQPLWNQLIKRSQSELLKLDQGERQNFQAQLDHFQLKEVSLDHQKLAQVMLNLRSKQREKHISSWLQNMPSYGSSPELWQAVGSAIHTVYFPSTGYRDLANVIQHVTLPQYALPFIAKKSSLHYPKDVAVALQYAKALFHESDLTFDSEFLDFTENSTFSSGDRDWVNERRAFVYARSMRWEKASALLQNGCPEHEYKLKEMVEEVYRLRTDHLQYIKEKFASMGYE